MEITLEMIETVKDRTGVSYKEAKEALEKTNGNVVDAIILIEDEINAADEKTGWVEGVIEKIKEFIKKGNISKITISKDGEVLLNLPVTVGILGSVVFPWPALVGVLAAFGTKCTIQMTDDKGNTIDLSETVKSKGGVVMDEVKSKGSDAYEYAKEKGAEFVNFAKDKVNDLRSRANNSTAEPDFSDIEIPAQEVTEAQEDAEAIEVFVDNQNTEV